MSIGTLGIPSLPITGVRNVAPPAPLPLPTLDLSFLTGLNTAPSGLGGSGLDSRITFARNSDATMVGPNGLIRRAPHNSMIQSQNISLWTTGTGTPVSFVANEVTAPDGTLTGTRVIVGTDASVPGPNGTTRLVPGLNVLSGYLRVGATVPWLRIRIGTAAATTNAWINLSTMTFGVFGAQTPGMSNGSVIQVDANWYRFSVLYICTVADSGSRNISYCGVTADLSTVSSNGNYFWIWGVQTEANPTASYYVRNDSNVSATTKFDQPRFNYNPTTLALNGLLLEEQRTNILLQSEDATSASWTKEGGVASLASTAGPRGTVATSRFVPNTTVTTHRLRQTITGLTVGTRYAVTLYVKGDGVPYLYINFDQLLGAKLTIDTQTGAFISGGINIQQPSVTPAPGGFFKISFVGTVRVVTTNVFVQANTLFNDVDNSVAFNGTDAFFVDCVQMEAGAFPTSYIPTTIAAATRANDVASITGTNFSSWFNAASPVLTWSVDAMIGSFQGTGFPHIAQLNDGSSANRVSFYLGQNSNVIAHFIRAGGITTAEETIASALTVGGIYSLASAIRATSATFARNGAIASTDTSTGKPASLTAVDFRDFGGLPFNGHIRKIRYWDTALSGAHLVAATTL